MVNWAPARHSCTDFPPFAPHISQLPHTPGHPSARALARRLKNCCNVPSNESLNRTKPPTMTTLTAALTLLPSWFYIAAGVAATFLSTIRLILHRMGLATTRRRTARIKLRPAYYLSKSSCLTYCAAAISGLTATALSLNGHTSIVTHLFAVGLLGAAIRGDLLDR